MTKKLKKKCKNHIFQKPYLSFTDCLRFLASSLSNLVNNLAEGIHKVKCKYGHNDKKCETCGVKYKDCNCCVEYTNFKKI